MVNDDLYNAGLGVASFADSILIVIVVFVFVRRGQVSALPAMHEVSYDRLGHDVGQGRARVCAADRREDEFQASRDRRASPGHPHFGRIHLLGGLLMSLPSRSGSERYAPSIMLRTCTMIYDIICEGGLPSRGS